MALKNWILNEGMKWALFDNNYIKREIGRKEGKAEFSSSLLQSSVSHDPSEFILICWLDPQETFICLKYF